MEGLQNNNFFIALKVPGNTGCHITVALAKNINTQQVNAMRNEWESLFKTLTQKDNGIIIQIGNYMKMGSDAQFDAYKCKPEDVHIHGLLKQFYRKYYSTSEGKRLFPELKMHITVDTQQRMDEIEQIIRINKGIIIVSEYIFDEKKVVNNVDMNEWKCSSCGIPNFESRLQCRVCMQPKQKKALYETPPPLPSAPPLTQKKAWYKDWDCQRCGNTNQFGSRAFCKDCNGPRPESARIK